MPEKINSKTNNSAESENARKVKEAAIKLFGKYGYGLTTVRMIAKEAGLSAGQITAHYGTKEQLLESIEEDIARITSEAYDPIEAEVEQLLDSGKMTREIAWKYIEKIVDMQIDFCLEPSNRDKIMMVFITLPYNEGSVQKTTATFHKTVMQKIEVLLAQVIQMYSQKKGYLRARTISRAVNGAITSFCEHNDFLMDEVYVSQFKPNSITWMKSHLRDYLLNSIKAADNLEDY